MIMKFDPFRNRLCRNIRNDLSESLIESIYKGSITPSLATAAKYESDNPEPAIAGYINTRISRYQTILAQIQTDGIKINDTYRIAILLWDQELFFEVHEWLEKKWHDSQGIEKKIMQALVRAAGTYVHLELGRIDSAEKIGSKARAGLAAHKASVPDMIDAELLIKKLKKLDPVPPKLGTGFD